MGSLKSSPVGNPYARFTQIAYYVRDVAHMMQFAQVAGVTTLASLGRVVVASIIFDHLRRKPLVSAAIVAICSR